MGTTVSPLDTLRAAVPRDGLERRTDGSYALAYPKEGVLFVLDRLRRQHEQLVGELRVESVAPAARTVCGRLVSFGELNLSSTQARSTRARLLAQRAPIKGFDWIGALERLAFAVAEAERDGEPAADLRTFPLPEAEPYYEVLGITLPKHHPTIIFGDGGSLKSYLALYIAGVLAQEGVAVGYLDYELDGSSHRGRLRRLFGDQEPAITYLRCDRPLVHDVDRVRRIISGQRLLFLVIDSVGYACDGPPEEAGTAMTYFGAVRRLGVGTLHIAHVSKQLGADQRPFGSVYWHNSARCTWYCRANEDQGEQSSTRDLLLINRKNNLGPLRPPVGLTVTFAADRTYIRTGQPADVPEFVPQLSVTHRIVHVLRGGALTVTQIAAELDLPVNTVSKTINRWLRRGKIFTVLAGTKTQRVIGLLDRDSCPGTPGHLSRDTGQDSMCIHTVPCPEVQEDL